MQRWVDSNSGAEFTGHFDGCFGNALHGWIVRSDTLEGGAKLGLYLDDFLLVSCEATIYRPDVQEAGFGDGKCGFNIPINFDLLEKLGSQHSFLKVKIIGSDVFVGEHELRNENSIELRLSEEEINKLKELLFLPLYLLSGVCDLTRESADPGTVPKLSGHRKLFSKAGIGAIDDGATRKLPAYLDFTRYRFRVDSEYDTQNNPEDYEHFLNWYLVGYSHTRSKKRTPLSKEIIDYLNEDIVFGGQSFKASRFMWWRIAQNPTIIQQMANPNEHTFYNIAYWWTSKEVLSLGFEDCLVPSGVIELLRAISDSTRDKDMPLTRFMEYFFAENKELHFLDLSKASHRTVFSLFLVLKSLENPYLLTYIPQRTIDYLLNEGVTGQSPFGKFCAFLGCPAEQQVNYSKFALIMRSFGYDLFSRSYLSTTPCGNRLHASSVPVPNGDKVDVQIIGPFAKASGLGQATRLSASILKHTNYSLNCVDFSLDNPAPEGFSSESKASDYVSSKVNLIHLNAESVPLVFAYAPDVFSDAYNIGYFYWELDSPALCHYLALDLLDEVWVSTEYGVSIYQPETEKPVSNVRMCYEDAPNIDRKASRKFIDSRFRLSGNEFLFLVAFDSFSFVQRKNPIGVLRAFQKAFVGDNGVRLIVKTQNRERVLDPVQMAIWKKIDSIISTDSRILLLNETLTYENLLALKAGSDAYVSLHKSEGWGFGMIEAMNLGVPVLCTGYSGNMEFCSDETAWLVDYEEVHLERDDYIFVQKGQKWAEPNIESAAKAFFSIRNDDVLRKKKSKAAMKNIRKNFSAKEISKIYAARLLEIIGNNGKA